MVNGENLHIKLAKVKVHIVAKGFLLHFFSTPLVSKLSLLVFCDLAVFTSRLWVCQYGQRPFWVSFQLHGFSHSEKRRDFY